MPFGSQGSKLQQGPEEGGWLGSGEAGGGPFCRTVLTRPPQLLALLLVGEAHAIVAVGLATLTGGAVHLVEVGGAMGRLARAEFWEVALPCLLTAQGPWGQQLNRENERGKNCQSPTCPQPYLQRTCEHPSHGTEFPMSIIPETSLA